VYFPLISGFHQPPSSRIIYFARAPYYFFVVGPNKFVSRTTQLAVGFFPLITFCLCRRCLCVKSGENRFKALTTTRTAIAIAIADVVVSHVAVGHVAVVVSFGK